MVTMFSVYHKSTVPIDYYIPQIDDIVGSSSTSFDDVAVISHQEWDLYLMLSENGSQGAE